MQNPRKKKRQTIWTLPFGGLFKLLAQRRRVCRRGMNRSIKSERKREKEEYGITSKKGVRVNK